MKKINQPLANIVARCIRNSPDSEVKRRELAKLRLLFQEQASPEQSKRFAEKLYG